MCTVEYLAVCVGPSGHQFLTYREFRVACRRRLWSLRLLRRSRDKFLVITVGCATQLTFGLVVSEACLSVFSAKGKWTCLPWDISVDFFHKQKHSIPSNRIRDNIT